MWKKFTAWLKTEIVTLGRAFKKAEAWAKSTLAVIVGGGMSALLDMYRTGQHFEMSAAHLIQLKTQFIGGALLALAGLWVHSPRDKTPPAS
jgi:ABC-type thiamin/hydroxymethylpyrimidine transport system permease subunit